MKANELINLSDEELEARYEDLCRDIFDLTNELRVSRKLEKPHELKNKKKDAIYFILLFGSSAITMMALKLRAPPHP